MALKRHKQLDDRASLIFYKTSNVSSRFHRHAREKFLVSQRVNQLLPLTNSTERNSSWTAVAFFFYSEGFVGISRLRISLCHVGDAGTRF